MDNENIEELNGWRKTAPILKRQFDEVVKERNALQVRVNLLENAIKGLLPDIEFAAKKLGFQPTDFENYTNAVAILNDTVSIGRE